MDAKRIAQFWSRVDRREPNECWNWTAGKYAEGYGAFGYLGRSFGAHRIAFFLHHKRWANGFTCHHCDNPACCNPSHLFEGTPADNAHDMIRKGRRVKGDHVPRESRKRGDQNWTRMYPDRVPRGDNHYSRKKPWAGPRGEKHGCSKLTQEQVDEIRARGKPPRGHLAGMARSYGISPCSLARILQGRSWIKIDPPSSLPGPEAHR